MTDWQLYKKQRGLTDEVIARTHLAASLYDWFWVKHSFPREVYWLVRQMAHGVASQLDKEAQ